MGSQESALLANHSLEFTMEAQNHYRILYRPSRETRQAQRERERDRQRKRERERERAREGLVHAGGSISCIQAAGPRPVGLARTINIQSLFFFLCLSICYILSPVSLSHHLYLSFMSNNNNHVYNHDISRLVDLAETITIVSLFLSLSWIFI